ncbi:TetR family transcriptional regulator [Streptomyces platensis]|uniref:TetR family transcriptional regulator n=2 Tax=Streptomyces TaxID=1883 RepID=A0AAE6NLN6_STRPT|nr:MULTISPECIES: TetR/AcrR family transcriptional regulator [Streptomyces]BCK68346.1 transcriptional regulator [Streptomyces libani subsp. rufus]OSY45167.1 transcriptional regulator BetI [Streptomyces platensis]QEV54883.1 TetR family transcriptional regulator [Streptomyces platensis]GFE14153.1 transcriptional regulator [Streptomyces glebosus]GHG76289.1 transcriptional regulator [Streptomyces glebosus]
MPGPARRPRRRLNQPREQVLAAAMATIAAEGLDRLTMAGLGREVGMSSGHILYYFGTKDELLLQTLQWSEEQLGAERRAALSRRVPARERLDALVDLYLPEGHRDPRWTLWLEVWNRSQNADDETRERQLELELAWHRDLVALLVEGISKGEFRPVDPERFATRTRALLDGFGSQLVVGLPGTERAEVGDHVREFLDESLSVPQG